MYSRFYKNVKSGLKLSNFATTSDVKKEILTFIKKKKKKDLASLKLGVDEADIDKLKTAFTNLSYLQNLAQRCEN